MSDLGSLVTIADKVFQLIQSPVLVELRDWKSALENLEKTVCFIKNMLLDADKKPELSHGEQGWVKELKEVLYEADDLFDEVITIANQKKLGEGAKLSKKVSDKVSRFFSSKNHILFSYNTSLEVKNIQQKLDAIARDRSRYEFKVDCQATRKRREDTCSFLNETDENIVGREDDVKALIDMLLDPNVEENVGFIAVVGVGGLGKTAIARLVSNHDRVKSEFHKNLWACVSDQDGKELDVQEILGKIIESSTNKKPDDVSTMESLQTKFRQELENKTYFLILDDLWTEDLNEWSKLRRYLTVGGKGSRVVVTTRSGKTAEVVLGKGTHCNKFMLKGLSDDDSWHLFRLTAFEKDFDQANNPNLTKTGKLIVKKCSNVPLAIKVLGTLLYGQTDKWESFEKTRLPEIEPDKNPILSILKLSYNNLEPSVKNCFSYCALFPKDYVMYKVELISLWVAQGYIDDSEDNFLILLKRCFFQDVGKDDCGDIIYCKMHDLMHDLACEVARGEIIVVNCPTNNIGKTIRHLFLGGGKWTKGSFSKRNIRTCYMMNMSVHSDVVKTIVAKWSCLRSLCLCVPDSEHLPESIGKLLHLRYLNLSNNCKLKTLPNSITKLYNLRSLILTGCYGLLQWPQDFCKLINLRRLGVSGCSRLTCMPLGMDKLTNLRELSGFYVDNVNLRGKQFGGQLNDLKLLVNLRGSIGIIIREDLTIEKEIVFEGGCLEHIKNLKEVSIRFPNYSEPSWEQIAKNEIVVAKLQPHRNLKLLCLAGYYGDEIPRWGRVEDDWATLLPNLVKIKLRDCDRLQGLPVLSNLKHLKSLYLYKLNTLEYMESNTGGSCSGSRVFFPSLQYLGLFHFKRLKGWWRSVGEGDSSSSSRSHLQLSFPRLLTLAIYSCPLLTSLPPCPSLNSLEVMQCHKSLRILLGEDTGNPALKLSVKKIDNLGHLTTVPVGRLSYITIKFGSTVTGLTKFEELIVNSCFSVQRLKINDRVDRERLVSLSRGLQQLTALESLSLESIHILDEEDENGMPWRSLRHSLLSLKLKSVGNMEILPTGMKHLTTLQNLTIERCLKLKGIPEWISDLSSLHSLKIDSCPAINSLPRAIQNLASLQKLEIHSCPDLIDICQEPSGEEWPKIRHIPHISFF